MRIFLKTAQLRSDKNMTLIHSLHHDVHIWPVEFNKIQALNSLDYAAVLSANETKKATSFVFENDRERFVIGRGLLRYLLGHYLDLPPKQLAITKNDKGKPQLLTHDIEFNVSHTDHYVVYAFTGCRRVGIDVEMVKHTSNLLGIAQRFFTPYEYNTLKTLPPEAQTEAFYRLWVCKEALVKALGKGLWLSLSCCDIDFMADPIRLNHLDHNYGAATDWHLCRLNLWPDCQAALAVEGKRIGKLYFKTLFKKNGNIPFINN